MNGYRTRETTFCTVAVPIGADAASEVAPPTEEKPSTAETLTQYAPVVKSLLESSASHDVEVYAAKIANLKRTRRKFRRGGIGWTVITNRIRVLQAKRRAAFEERAEDRTSWQSRRSWAFLGKAGLVTGIGVGAAAIVLLLSLSRRRRR